MTGWSWMIYIVWIPPIRSVWGGGTVYIPKYQNIWWLNCVLTRPQMVLLVLIHSRYGSGGQRDMSTLNDVTFRQNELSFCQEPHLLSAFVRTPQHRMPHILGETWNCPYYKSFIALWFGGCSGLSRGGFNWFLFPATVYQLTHHTLLFGCKLFLLLPSGIFSIFSFGSSHVIQLYPPLPHGMVPFHVDLHPGWQRSCSPCCSHLGPRLPRSWRPWIHGLPSAAANLADAEVGRAQSWGRQSWQYWWFIAGGLDIDQQVYCAANCILLLICFPTCSQRYKLYECDGFHSAGGFGDRGTPVRNSKEF